MLTDTKLKNLLSEMCKFAVCGKFQAVAQVIITLCDNMMVLQATIPKL